MKFNSSLLTEPTDFVCELTIPRTNYFLSDRYTFYPGKYSYKIIPDNNSYETNSKFELDKIMFFGYFLFEYRKPG